VSAESPVAAAEELCGVQASSAQPIGGAAYRVELANGDAVVAKRHEHPNAAPAEAASLTWLAEPGVVNVPKVFAHDENWLVTELVEGGRATSEGAEDLGRNLAKLHGAGAPAFGAAPPDGPQDAWIGLAPMRNEPCDGWPEFYAAHRVEPYVRKAVDRGLFTSGQAQYLKDVMKRIDRLAGPPEPPARLHGDLWSGNVLWALDGTAWLIDPAAHGGHRETDLAMLDLFGCPHLDVILSAYEDESPLAEGWRDRVPLHQLFPLLVHTVLFGTGYAGRTISAAKAALSAS
jgi:fructosamine-3-kinase